ncbi:MAG: hypothetical protein JRI28_06745 [Deltaproteobacteria bacterium]|nr:hypothetical protein [Deltaproteobacteria bacterium]
MKVIIQKPDLDTCLAALILNVNPSDEIVISKGDASEKDIMNPDILCIEAGGSGLVHLNNFDHHNTDTYVFPACRQALDHKEISDDNLNRLVEYVCMVDEKAKQYPVITFPSLSNVFSGMLFVEKTPLLKFLKGMEILERVLNDAIDPFESMPDIGNWQDYISAKQENRQKLETVLRHGKFYTSRGGLKIGFADSSDSDDPQKAIGGIGTLYSMGCDVAVMYNPEFGDPPVPKYTIAGNYISVIHLKDVFEKIEHGWGGRETIIDSPRTGTRLDKNKVLEEVINNL